LSAVLNRFGLAIAKPSRDASSLSGESIQLKGVSTSLGEADLDPGDVRVRGQVTEDENSAECGAALHGINDLVLLNFLAALGINGTGGLDATIAKFANNDESAIQDAIK
jgi:hypothetical protein